MDALALHRAMLDPATYPDGEEPIEFRETHVSRLYLTPRFVFKIKKPVDFGFLDFTDLQKRRFFCHEEVQLNRRFAPDTYLDVLPLCRAPAGLRLGGDGEVVDYVVHMRRLPAERMLDRLVASDDPGLPAEMERLGWRLAALHAESAIFQGNGGTAHLATVRRNWDENFRQAAPFVGHTLSARALGLLTAYVDQFLAAQPALLNERERQGFVRDGHGDLHAEHICLTDPIRIYDCIEFNRRFRIADTAADLAFLLMDLEFRRRRDLAALVREFYSPEDADLDRLLPFYKVYRAFVRGKVESFLAADRQAATATRDTAAAVAAQYFNLALGYLCPPVLVLIGGLMGTGKSTVGAALAAALRGALLSSDRLRKELAGDPTAGKNAGFGEGIYSAAFSRRTYDHLLHCSRDILAGGGSVVADASFQRRADRERFRQAGEQSGIPVLTVSTECAREIVLARLDTRWAADNDPSDGRRELYDRQAAGFEAPSPGENGIIIDTSRPVAYNVQLLLCEIIARAGMRR